MRWLPWVLVVVLAVAVFYLWTREPEPVYRDVIVTKEVIEQVEVVDTIVSLKEKIVYVEKEPETTATAVQGAVGLVRSFCEESVAESLAGGDSISPVRPVLLLRSARVSHGWFMAPDEVVLTGPLSSGDLKQLRYRVRGDWRAHVRGDGVLVQSSRFPVREVIEPAVWVSVGGLLGYLMGVL